MAHTVETAKENCIQRFGFFEGDAVTSAHFRLLRSKRIRCQAFQLRFEGRQQVIDKRQQHHVLYPDAQEQIDVADRIIVIAVVDIDARAGQQPMFAQIQAKQFDGGGR